MSKFSIQGTLDEWDCKEESNKAFFMQKLYDHYGRTCGTFTGLWEQYKEDLAKRSRELVMSGSCSITELFMDPSKL